MSKDEIMKVSRKKVGEALKNSGNPLGFDQRNIYKILNFNKNIVIIGLRRIGKTLLLNTALRKFLRTDDIKSMSNVLPTRDIKITSSIEEIDINNKTKVVVEGSANKNLSGDEKILNKIIYLKFDDIMFEAKTDQEWNRVLTNIKEIVLNNDINLLLLDEIQKLPNWNILLKDIYDAAGSSIKIIATGSDAKLIQETRETGVGRFQLRYYGVLTYKEAEIIYSDISLGKYIDYLHFPGYSTIEEYDDEIRQAIVEKAFAGTTTKKRILYGILRVISNNVGEILNKNKISKMSEVNKTHLESYLSSLVMGQVIFELPNRNLNNNNSKYYPLIPGMNRLFSTNKFNDLNTDKKGHLFEQFVIVQILCNKPLLADRMDLSYIHTKIKGKEKKRCEIDLIFRNKGYEIKFTNNIDRISQYVDLAIKNNLAELNFIYDGESMKSNNYSIPVKFWNWKDFNYDI